MAAGGAPEQAGPAGAAAPGPALGPGVEAVLDGPALSAVREAHRLEGQRWWEGWSVEVRDVPLRPELRGRRGVTRGLDGGEGGRSRRFLVEVEGPDAELACHALPFEQLAWPFGGGGSSGSGAPAGGTSGGAGAAAVEAVRALFKPGSQFRGTIVIPGVLTPDELEQEEEADRRREYTLEVVEESVDELGRRSLTARHAAYDDVQTCHISFEAVEEPGQPAKVKVSFADGETCCEGILTADQAEDEACAFRGRVMQLVQGEEGFYERSTEVTHFFELFRTTSCEVEAQRARHLEQARRRRLESLGAWFEAASLTEEKRCGLRELPWMDIIVRDTAHHYEDRCAALRRQSALLDSLAFATREEKEQVLSRLRDAGLSRGAAHASTDTVMALMKNLLNASMKVLVESGRIHEVQFWVVKAQQRIGKSYSQLDQSLRSAEARPPRDMLAGWLRLPEAGGELLDPCSVCFLPLEGGAESARLPCGHWFHPDCISQWLHARASCPNCRVALDAPAPEAAPPPRAGAAASCPGPPAS